MSQSQSSEKWCASIGVKDREPVLYANDWTSRHNYVCQYDGEYIDCVLNFLATVWQNIMFGLMQSMQRSWVILMLPLRNRADVSEKPIFQYITPQTLSEQISNIRSLSGAHKRKNTIWLKIILL